MRFSFVAIAALSAYTSVSMQIAAMASRVPKLEPRVQSRAQKQSPEALWNTRVEHADQTSSVNLKHNLIWVKRHKERTPQSIALLSLRKRTQHLWWLVFGGVYHSRKRGSHIKEIVDIVIDVLHNPHKILRPEGKCVLGELVRHCFWVDEPNFVT
ncbi:uncharacterized protein EDB93DRAFT_1339444 [Suillus bovinus]|uniref:uncharacterized protein n=1 Tax=Suillus bovinus TaxID=48563 RepID=UPI001B864703|nr:uncharacterized protein EDB93DRAFT_1339444 [Suillus bovinus]KAG2136541.1 hypothetical protein EDB93DRAFT_1339444 [Suillus bovinus]